MSKNVLLLGSVNVDIAVKLPKIPTVDEVVYCEEFNINLGGKASNAAVGFSRMGYRPHLLACVGNDDFAKRSKTILNSEKVNIKYLKILKNAMTGNTIVEVDSKGKNVIIVNKAANHKIQPKYIDEPFSDFDKGKLKIDLLYTTMEPEEDIVNHAINEASKRKILVFCDAAPRLLKKIVKNLSKIDFIAPNQKEAEFLSGVKVDGINRAFEAALRIREKGANTVIITMSSLGAVLLEKRKSKPEYFKVEKVKAVDETAAGDAFRMGFCVEYLKSGNMQKAMVFANKTGGFTTTKFGAYDSMPRLYEIVKRIGKKNGD